MSKNKKNIRFQAEEHLLKIQECYTTLAQYFQNLMHIKAYEVVREMIKGLKVLDLGCNIGYETRIQ